MYMESAQDQSALASCRFLQEAALRTRPRSSLKNGGVFSNRGYPWRMSRTQIWVDADACPNVIKEILYRAAEREQLQVTLIANQPIGVPRSRFVRSVQVCSRRCRATW